MSSNDLLNPGHPKGARGKDTGSFTQLGDELLSDKYVSRVVSSLARSNGSTQGGDHDESDPDQPSSTENPITPGRNRWVELPSPSVSVKAVIYSSAARPLFATPSSFSDTPFLIQSCAFMTTATRLCFMTC